MGANDDFLVPSGVDLSLGCDIDRTVEHRGDVLRTFAVLSIACYLYLFWMYFVVKTPVLKRHPTKLAIYGCLIEMGYFQQYLWLPTIGRDYLYSDDALMEPYYCNSSAAASRWAFITQFCIIGVQMCFLVISVDLRQAYTNPFSSFKHNKYYFATAVISFSLFTSICLLWMGPKVYGYDEHGVIWIQDSRASLAMNWPKFVLYYLIITCVFCYSIWANFQFYRSSEKGLSVTLSNRLSIMNRSKRFVIGHITCYSVILALEFLSFLNNADYQILLSLPSYLQALRGVLGTIVILYSNWEDVTWRSMNPFYFAASATDTTMVERVALEGLMQQPHLNTALRAEILYFSTQGMMFAAKSFGVENGFEDNQRSVTVDSDFGVPLSKQGRGEGNNTTADNNDEVYGFESQGDNRPSVVEEPGRLSAVPVKLMTRKSNTGGPDAATTGGNISTRDTFSYLSKFHKAQDEAIQSVREEAFKNEVAYLGLARESVSFKGVDHRHNSSSSAKSPYSIPSLTGKQSQQSKQSQLSNNTSINASSGGTRNPLSMSGSMGHAFRPSELEMRHTGTGRGESVNKRQSTDSVLSSSSEATVKWKDTTDVEFTMGRADNDNSSGPDAWYKVPTSPTGASKIGRNGPGARDHNPSRGSFPTPGTSSDTQGSRSHSNINAVDKVRRTLQTALSNAQNMFNPAYREFRFKDFSPGLFAKVREMCNITPAEYARSFEATCKETFSEGRSGAFMFFSSDQKCIAKSTPKHELLSLQKLMPAYVDYLMHNPNTLITRFLGAHCITMYGVELHFVVMLNCFPSHRLSERYDLKGSWVNRHALVKGTSSVRGGKKDREMMSSPMLYLDNDLQHKLSLLPGVASLIVEQIYKDSDFLTLHKKMDYSLLIGVKKERFEVILHDGLEDTSGGSFDPRNTTTTSAGSNGASKPGQVHSPHTPEAARATISAPNGRITDHARTRSSSVSSRPASHRGTPTGKMRVISRNDEENLDEEEEDGGGGLHTHFVEGPAKYYIGIIDVLQEWNLTKQIERFIKVHLYRQDADGISAINPTDYQKRFLRRGVLDTFEGLEEEQSNPSCVSGQTGKGTFGR